MSTRVRFPALVLALALAFSAAGCGSSGSDDDGAPTTSRPASDPEDAALMDGVLAQYQPGIELMFNDKTTDCVLDAFTEAALGDQSDEAALSQYEACGISPQEVTGALMAAQLLGREVSEDNARCVGKAVGKLSDDELSAMDVDARDALAAECGVAAGVLGS